MKLYRKEPSIELLCDLCRSTFDLIKCLKTARRRYKDMHPKVLKLKSMREKCCGNDKLEYEQKLAADRSTGKLFKYFRAFKKNIFPALFFIKMKKQKMTVTKPQLFSKFLRPFTYNLLNFMSLFKIVQRTVF